MNALQRLLSNAFLALIANTIAKVSGSILFILIGRQIGPAEAGTFNLGVTYYTILMGLSTLGLHELLVREVAPRREKSNHYLVNYLVMRLASSTLLYIGLLLFLQLNLPYSEETKSVLRIMSLAIFPEAIFSLCQSYFIAHERQAVPTLSALINAAVRLGLGVYLLRNGAGAVAVAWVMPISTTISLLVFPPAILRITRQVPQSIPPRFNLRFIHRQLLVTPSFLVIHFFSIVDYQTDTFLISIMLSEAAVGWYGAAQTILLAFWVMPRAIRMALYPLMARYYVHAPGKLDILYEKSFQYLLIICLPMVAGVFLLAEEIIFLVFGPSFAPSIPVLKWSIWGVIFVFLNVPNARLMILHNEQRVLSWMTGISMLTNVSLNLLLIPLYGIVGAAISRLSASFILFISMYLFVQVRISPDAKLWRYLPRTVLAVSLMSVTVLLLRDMPLIWPVFAGAAVYILSSLVLGVIPAEDRAYWQSLLRRVDYTK